jgi:hypothetical protein
LAISISAAVIVAVAANTVHNAKNAGTGTLRVLSTYVLETGKPRAIPVK